MCFYTTLDSKFNCCFQDHLELFNGAIRSSLGANNNPTCKQFESVFKRLLVKLDIKDVKGNAEKQDDTSLLVVSSVPRKRKPMFDLAMRPDAPQEDANDENILNDPSLVRKEQFNLRVETRQSIGEIFLAFWLSWSFGLCYAKLTKNTHFMNSLFKNNPYFCNY